MSQSGKKRSRGLWWDFRYIWMFISSILVLLPIVGLIATWLNNDYLINHAPWELSGAWEEIHRPFSAQVAATILVSVLMIQYLHTLYWMYFGRSNETTHISIWDRWVPRLVLLAIPILLSELPYENEFGTWPMTFVFFVIVWTLTSRPESAFASVIVSTGVSAAVLWFQYDEGAMINVGILCLAFGFFTSGYVINRGLVNELRLEQSRVRDQAVTEERFRLARDLHDTVGHSMTQITLKAELARRLIPNDPARAERELSDVEQLSRSLSAEVRKSIAGEVTLSLEREIARATELLQSMEIDVEVSGDHAEIPERIADALAWCLREGVMNVIKHSGADRCAITFASEAQQQTLTITDNGGNPVRNDFEGQGIAGMRQRVSDLSGEIELREIESGHELSIRIPA